MSNNSFSPFIDAHDYQRNFQVIKLNKIPKILKSNTSPLQSLHFNGSHTRILGQFGVVAEVVLSREKHMVDQFVKGEAGHVEVVLGPRGANVQSFAEDWQVSLVQSVQYFIGRGECHVGGVRICLIGETGGFGFGVVLCAVNGDSKDRKRPALGQ